MSKMVELLKKKRAMMMNKNNDDKIKSKELDIVTRLEMLKNDILAYCNSEYFFVFESKNRRYYVINKNTLETVHIFESVNAFAEFVFNIYDLDVDELNAALNTKYTTPRSFISKALSKQLPFKFIYNPKDLRESYLDDYNKTFYINLFKKTKYMEIADNIEERHTHLNEEDFKKTFPHFYVLLMNLCENDYNKVKLLLNYIADIVQYREKTNVVFVFKSTPGTGKGLFLDSVCKPLLHKKQVILQNVESLEGRFNAELAQSLLVNIDESEYDIKKNSKLSDKIKSIASNKTIRVEKKGKDAEYVDTYFNFIIYTNNTNGMKVEPDDRRYYVFEGYKSFDDIIEKEFNVNESVRDYCKAKFFNTKEAEEFLTYVATLKVNKNYSRRARLVNESKINMIFNTNNLVDIFTKVITRKELNTLRFLYNKILEINEENLFENENLEDKESYKKYPVINKDDLDVFFLELITKGRVRKSLTHRVLEVFLSSSVNANYNTKRISLLLHNIFPQKKIKGIRYYAIGFPADFTVDDFFEDRKNENSLPFEESFTLNELDNLLAKASSI